MTFGYQLILQMCLGALLTAPCWAQAESASDAGQYPSPERFEDAIKAFEKEDQAHPPPEDAILCIGSSSMRGWHEDIGGDLAPLTLIPRGFGGSNMNDALHFADRIVIPYRPRAIVIYEGDNDTAQGVSPEKIRDTFLAFVTTVHDQLPKTRMYFLAIKPSISRWHLWSKMRKANGLIAEVCSQNELLNFVDTASAMLDPDGKVRDDIFLDDNLHMNRKGYEIWRDVLRPILLESELQYEP
jgi:lysophospholipase L1-like esterase